jgi:regulator of protease activity HflC (stomatin/prohibitin superfamily)
MINQFLWIIVAAAAVIAFLAAALKIFREYERGVMFTLGWYTGTMGPGLIIMVPIIQRMVRVDLRTRVFDMPPQDLITHDNVSARVNAVVFYRVLDAEKAVIQVEDFEAAIHQLSQTTLRSVLGKNDLDTMLAERARLNDEVQQILDEHTAVWGIRVSNVEIKQVDLDRRIIEIMALQAEAERNRRAKVLDSLGEEQAADKFLEAAEVLSRNPQSMQLRYLNAINSIASNDTKTIVFPLPANAIAGLARWIAGRGRGR